MALGLPSCTHLCDAEMTFVLLTSGGHNAGIISEPGHAHRSYRMAARPAHGPWIEPEEMDERRPTRDPGARPGHQWPRRSRRQQATARPVVQAPCCATHRAST